MSLLKKTTSRNAKKAEPVSAKRSTKAGKTPKAGKAVKRVFATAGAGLTLFTLAACGPKEKIELENEEQTSSQSATSNKLQQQVEQLQKDLKDLQNDVSKLKDNDAAMLKIISSNMTIVQQLITNLQSQISSVASQTGTNQDIESLKQSQTEIAGQLSTLQSDMKKFASELETLKGQTDTTDSKTVKKLQQTVDAMQSKVNQLALENAANYSLNTRYSYLNTHGLEGGDLEAWIAPNGDYVSEVGRYQYAVQEDELGFVRENGEEKIYLDFVGNGDSANPMGFIYTPIEKATNIVVDENQNYVVTSSEYNLTLTYSVENGYISQITDGEVYYSLFDDNKQNYDTSKDYVSSHIGVYRNYKGLKQAFDNTAKSKYGQILNETSYIEEGKKQTEKSNMVFASDGYAVASENDGPEGGIAAGYCEDGKAIQAVAYNDGTYDSDSFDYQPQFTFKQYMQGFFSDVFWGHEGDTATISYNKKQNSYSVTINEDSGETQNSKTIYNFEVNENDEVVNFSCEFYYTDEDVNVSKYTVNGLTKAQAQKLYNEIKIQYEELLAKKNEKENNANV